MLTLEVAVDRLFEHSGRDDGPMALEPAEGSLPSLPRGTWYLNGPGRFDVGGHRYRHWLDGDGLVRALRFDDGRVTFTSRFVRTRKFCEETRAGRPLFRAFGSAHPDDRLNDRHTGLESPANVSIVHHAGALLALGEQGQPWQIDPSTLETVGAYSASGAVTSITPFAAHAKVDATTGELFNFGVSFSPDRPVLNVFKFDAAGAQVFRARVALPYCCTIHDFALGPAFAVFYISPYLLDMSRLRAGASVVDSLTWRPELGSRALLVSRDTGALEASVPLGARYCLHTINCYARGSAVVLDAIAMAQPIYDTYTLPYIFQSPIDAVPVRFVIDPVTQRIIDRTELSGASAPEFAAIDSADAMREYQECWALGMSAGLSHGPKFFDRLVRFRWDTPDESDTYTAPAGVLLGGEPLIVRGDGGRWVLCQVFDCRDGRSGFAVFAAHDVARGPVARMWLATPTPMAFHGLFIAD